MDQSPNHWPGWRDGCCTSCLSSAPCDDVPSGQDIADYLKQLKKIPALSHRNSSAEEQ